MTTYLCLSPNRVPKTRMIMEALAHGWPDAKIVTGPPPEDGKPFIVWGQIWLAEEIIPRALKQGRKFFQIDNGFYKSARGSMVGYYRFMYCRPDPVYLSRPDLHTLRMSDAGIKMPWAGWRKTGSHVLIAMPGPDFGRAFGIDVPKWTKTIEARVREHTHRPIRVRSRLSQKPLSDDLNDCWAIVTHSSNVAVDAVIGGLPAFVEKTSATAPLGNLDLKNLDQPNLASANELRAWWASLMCQQFTLSEMRSGLAHSYLSAVMEQAK